MASNIDVTIPPFGAATTAGVRVNFASAKAEIDALQSQSGYADYSDLATQTTPINLVIGTWVKLTNDTLGPYTRISALPSGVTRLWDATTNQMWFDQLPIDSIITARYDVVVTTTAVNQVVELAVALGIGSPSEYQSNRSLQHFKAAGTYNIVAMGMSYIGSNDIKNFPSEIRIKSDAAGTVKVNGWLINAQKRIL